MNPNYKEQDVIIQLFERLAALEAKIDSLIKTIDTSNSKIESAQSIATEALYSAKRAHERIDVFKGTIIRFAAATATVVGILVSLVQTVISSKGGM